MHKARSLTTGHQILIFAAISQRRRTFPGWKTASWLSLKITLYESRPLFISPPIYTHPVENSRKSISNPAHNFWKRPHYSCSPSRYPEKSVRRVRNIRRRGCSPKLENLGQRKNSSLVFRPPPPPSRSEGEGETSGKRRRVKRFAVIYGTRARFLAIKGSFLIVIFLID